MINSKKIESDDEDDKFFQHKVLPTDGQSNTKNNDNKNNQTYPSMPPNMNNPQQYQPQHNQNMNIQFNKPNYNYQPQGYNPWQQNPNQQYNRPPNFSAPQGYSNMDQRLTPDMYNGYGMQPNTGYSMPQQNQQTDVSLHDFQRKYSNPQRRNPYNGRPF